MAAAAAETAVSARSRAGGNPEHARYTSGSPPSRGRAGNAPEPHENEALFQSVLRLGDNALILGQQLSNWVSRAPNIELDIALANYSLDLIGQARLFLDYAGRLEGNGRDEDALAMLRDAWDFRNVLLVELPNGDFAHTILRQFLLAVHARLLYERMASSADAELAAIAGKAVKEKAYHARHAGEWVVRLGDGTEESRERAARTLDGLWPYTHELFMADEIDRAMAVQCILPEPGSLREPWLAEVDAVLERATLTRPADGWRPDGGRRGIHTEHLGYILAEMQFLPRAYPEARQW